MNKSINQCEIPIPPSANRIWRIYLGRQILSKEYRSWKEHAALAIKLGMNAIHDKVELTITIHGGSGFPRSRDLDNCAKSVIDAIRHAGMIDGDTVQTVVAIHLIYKECPVKKQPKAKCFIRITPFGEADGNRTETDTKECDSGTDAIDGGSH